MGASRKLQGEIDRVLKRVQEGVDIFDNIWNKVHETDNANQKEKFEAELKKEIKKLQRYRDQIKTWQLSTEIKDKKVSASYEQALVDSRKLIEKEMERFKICEKETKTKAFSKEGLEQQPKLDPKEKAKSETREWVNNTVSELESQIDSFEAEMEGLIVKKGKTRPPRLTHLESSINRHKAHIMKLELILRLLDNDELSPEQVNDVKDFLDDYVERNQEDFDEFDDVDMLYNTLPLDKVESLEDLVTIGPPSLVKGVGAAGVGGGLSIKAAMSTSPSQLPASATLSIKNKGSVQDQANEMARTPPPKNNALSSAPPTTAMTLTTPVAVGSASVLSGPSSVKGILDNSSSSVPSSLISSAAKEEEDSKLSCCKPSPALPEAGLKNLGRGGPTNPPSISVPITSGGAVCCNRSLDVTADKATRVTLGCDERLAGSGIMQPIVSSPSSRMILPPHAKTGDAVSGGDGGGNGEVGGMTSMVFSPSGVLSIQGRSGNPFPSQHEGLDGRTEIAPDHKVKFLERFELVRQQGQGNLLGKTPLSGGIHMQFSAPQNPLLQQLQFRSQTSVSSPQSGLVGGPAAGVIAATSAHKTSPIHSQSGQHMLIASGLKNTEAGSLKANECQQHMNLLDDSAKGLVLAKNTANEDNSKVFYTKDAQSGVSGFVTKASQVTRDTGLSPGQPLQSNQSSNIGVIGRRNVSDCGAVGDTVSISALTLGPSHDQKSIMQLLESSFYKLPQPKDSDRIKSYTPRHPALTPQSYPQAPAPIVSSPAFWERLGSDIGLDTLFFAFYYQQNMYQQYLAARELKKQAWRYHKKYNTWFQRHEEPKIATDDYEQGTYVYFDFHLDDENEEIQNGWCQRIKTEFDFEYQYLEDELTV
uniref:CCR4-NOT transcription complex subunit 3-like n=1 Tax=Erigeron canadensis TaxID=72917 RepID=UPI001CB89FDB|nr:CCR4-NOT transcription complex subunit 3-like [Erigeron canadensis]